MCCPGCCRSPDLGTHEWCVDCDDNPCCRSVHRNERDPIYDRPSPNERHGIHSSVAEEMLQACMDKYNISEKDQADHAVTATAAAAAVPVPQKKNKHAAAAVAAATGKYNNSTTFTSSDVSASAASTASSSSKALQAAVKGGVTVNVEQQQQQQQFSGAHKARGGGTGAAQGKQKCAAM